MTGFFIWPVCLSYVKISLLDDSVNALTNRGETRKVIELTSI